MVIRNDDELRDAVTEASGLIQQIHDYCVAQGQTIADVPNARVRFPRGFIRTAEYHRQRFPFLTDRALKSNIAYTPILSDTILWLAVRTDVGGMARDMLNKLFIVLVGSVIESVTKSYLHGHCGRNFSTRAQFLVDEGVILEELRNEICWVWDTRNRIHLFQLDGPEYVNDYNEESHHRTIRAFRGLLAALSARGPFGES